jgi:transposase
MRACKTADWQLIAQCLEEAHDPVVRHRLAAIGAVACGNTVAEVSRWFDVSRQTLYNWMERLARSGFSPNSLALSPRPGRPPQWQPRFDAVLASALAQSPLELGFKSRQWTVRLLQGHLLLSLGQNFSPDTLRRQVRRLGYSWKRPRIVLASDPDREKKSPIAGMAAAIA